MTKWSHDSRSPTSPSRSAGSTDSAPALVDAHVHLIDPAAPGLSYDWATELHPLFGGVVLPLGEPPWTAERLLAEPSEPPVARRVHVQCADPTCDPILETLFVAAQAERGAIGAIVARAPLAEADCDALLDRQLESSALVRGIRDMTSAQRLDEPADVQCTAAQMRDVARLARRHPDLQVVLAHAGLAVRRSPDDLGDWGAQLAALAQAPNVACKLSGLGMGDHAWSVESWRPWVETALEAFGASRCLFGSNWPVDRLFSSYQAVLDAQLAILASLSEPERAAIFAENAARVYRL
jgi:predicted TIM-barrel fold metal-dependent hydrolase